MFGDGTITLCKAVAKEEHIKLVILTYWTRRQEHGDKS